MQSQNYSFVVRVWLESTYSDGKSAVWRGSIEQVGGDCRIYLSDLDGIPRYIQTQIGMNTSTSRSGWQLFWEQLKNDVQKLWKRVHG